MTDATKNAPSEHIIEVVISGAKHTIDISDLTLTEDGVNKALCHQAGKFAHVAGLAAKARIALDRAEDSLKITKATIEMQIRSTSEKKPTEDAIKSMVSLDKRVSDGMRALSALREDEVALNVLVSSYSQRKDCLIALASNLRSQMANLSGNSV